MAGSATDSAEQTEGAHATPDARSKVSALLREHFYCPPDIADGAAQALDDMAITELLELWSTDQSSFAEVMHSLLEKAGPLGSDASKYVLRRFGLVLERLPDDVVECAYWAETFDELAERSAKSFNTLHKYSTDVSDTPFPHHCVLDALRNTLLRDFQLVPESLYLHAAFFIHYGEDLNTSLRRHVDNSLLTINLCLSTSRLCGCRIKFYGGRNLNKLQNESFYSPGSSVCVDVPPECVLLHFGDHEHETTPWQAGDRSTLIMWFKER
eukprot:TRINITY_DN14517_c0_g1_i1.p1 TRINITY_DN14517_c0_g1~~TRINITY_DN14517_c0_g1_i1.p1  ORF type:complete len:268 (-),score=26.66 TRINITY_DN14517_c0_g1_i1:562-1365(-)